MAKKKFKISGFEDRIKTAAFRGLGLGAGAITARGVGKLAMLSSLSPAIQGGAKIVIGSLISAALDNGNDNFINTIGMGAGDGMVAIGSMELFGHFIPAVAGIAGEDDNAMYGVGLLDGDSSAVEGTDDDIDGFADNVINGTDDVAN